MPCVLTRKSNPTLFFEGPKDGEVTIEVVAEDGSTAILLALTFAGKPVTVNKKKCATFKLETTGDKSVDYLVEVDTPGAWVKLVESCTKCGGEDFKVLSRFKPLDPPDARQLLIRVV